MTYLTRAALILAATAIVSPALAADYTLRATANSNEDDEDYDGLIVFENFVETNSNGAIEVEIFMGTQLCTTGEECLQGVSDGSIDIYMSTSGGAAGIFPYIQVLDLPYLMDNDRVAEHVLSGSFPEWVQSRALEDSGETIRLMTIGNTGGWRSFANTQKIAKTPADLEGMKLRTVPADLPQELTRALGASPTPIAWPELFTSLQTGVVEGTANGITDIVNMKFTDAGLKYITLDNHAYMAAFWWMNNQKFQELPEDLQAVVADGFAALQQATFASPKRKSIAAYEAFTEAGGEVYVPTPEEKAAFRDAAEPVVTWFADNISGGEDALDALGDAVSAAENAVGKARAAQID